VIRQKRSHLFRARRHPGEIERNAAEQHALIRRIGWFHPLTLQPGLDEVIDGIMNA
jgi:hypothetical protein